MIRYITDTADLDRMLQIERLSFPTPLDESDVRESVTQSRLRCMGIYEEKTLAGWGCVHTGIYEAHLMTIAVHPDYRHRGYGKALLMALIRASADAGCTYMELECRRGNTAARSLYEAAGFIRTLTKPGYYGDTGEDALIYVLPSLPEGNAENDPYLIRDNTED